MWQYSHSYFRKNKFVPQMQLKFNMTCRGICERHRAVKKRYTDNAKRCTSCNVYVFYDGIKCPCCNTQLRAKRKSKKIKKEL